VYEQPVAREATIDADGHLPLAGPDVDTGHIEAVYSMLT